MDALNNTYVVIDVGCLECGIETSVVGIYESEEEARTAASARARKYEEDGELEAPDPYPDSPTEPRTVIAQAECYDRQISVEVHKVSGQERMDAHRNRALVGIKGQIEEQFDVYGTMHYRGLRENVRYDDERKVAQQLMRLIDKGEVEVLWNEDTQTTYYRRRR